MSQIKFRKSSYNHLKGLREACSPLEVTAAKKPVCWKIIPTCQTVL